MDTTPFHLILFALDITVLGGLYIWLRFRRNRRSVRSQAFDIEQSLYVPSVYRQPSRLWDLFGVLFFGGFGFVCFAALSRLIHTDFWQENVYHFNVGQCIAEGIAVHWTLFLMIAALLLYKNRRYVSAVGLFCCAAVLALGSFDALYWEPYHVKVERYEIKTPKLKKPLRIVFVTDIQTDRVGFHEIKTLKTIQQQKADLIILGGDYIQTFQNTREKQLPEKFRQMLIDHPLEAPLGVYAVAGNITGHGGVNDAGLFKGTNVELISSSTVFDQLGSNKGLGPIDMILLGLEDSRGGVGKDGLTDSGNFTVMAGHYPNYAIDGYTGSSLRHLIGYREMDRAPDLMLAGHTHGGQIVIPFYGPVPWGGGRHAAQIPRIMRGGFFTYPNGGHLLVSRGSGLERGWAPRVRFFCRSEVSVIDIVPME